MSPCHLSRIGVARDRGTWEPETEPGVSPGRSPRGTRDGGATGEPAGSRGKPAGGQVVLGRAGGDQTGYRGAGRNTQGTYANIFVSLNCPPDDETPSMHNITSF